MWQNVWERRYPEKQKPRMANGRGGEGSGEEAIRMEDDRRLHRLRGQPPGHRLNAPIWPEEEGSHKGGGQSTEEYGGRTVQKV